MRGTTIASSMVKPKGTKKVFLAETTTSDVSICIKRLTADSRPEGAKGATY